MEALGPNATVPEDARGAAIALGNFDGVHLGHQAVIASARAVAEERRTRLGAAVFEPHPRRFFKPDLPPFRLQTPKQRARALGDILSRERALDAVVELLERYLPTASPPS